MRRTARAAALALTGLSGCAQVEAVLSPATGGQDTAAPAVSAPPPPSNARTVEDFDTTTADQRAAAAASPGAGGRVLGTATATLGDPSEPGFWATTPLVSRVTSGRLVVPGTAKAVEVELRPGEAGTRVSLAALRVLGLSLTDLVALEIVADG